jgi:hypothetical protein
MKVYHVNSITQWRLIRLGTYVAYFTVVEWTLGENNRILFILSIMKYLTNSDKTKYSLKWKCILVIKCTLW